MMEQDQSATRLPDRKKLSFETTLLILFALLTGGMAFGSMLNLINDQGIALWFKAGLIGFAAGLVSFAVNKFAIERGAPQAAKGYLLAPMVSISSILIIGLGLFASTYSGLVIKQVRELDLQEYGHTLGNFVSSINQKTLEANRIVPVVDSSISDIRAKRQCEFESGCLNAKGIAGSGPTTRALDALVERAQTIQDQLANAKSERGRLLAALNRHLSDYQSTLGKTDKSLEARRVELIGLSAHIHQSASALKEALPLALLQAYAGELQSGLIIPNRPTATQNVNSVLRQHGQGLSNVLTNIENDEIVPPQFPAQAGVSSTFEFIGHFFPVAILTAAIELVLPLALWIYTLMDRRWEIYEHDTRSDSAPTNSIQRVSPSQNSGTTTSRQNRRNKKRQPPSQGKGLNGSSQQDQSGRGENEQ